MMLRACGDVYLNILSLAGFLQMDFSFQEEENDRLQMIGKQKEVTGSLNHGAMFLSRLGQSHIYW